MLTWKHQNFTGPTDLPVPPSREVVEHQAYEAVKKNGGVTIDLAGHVPSDGYAYAPFKGTEMIVPEDKFTPEHIDRFINQHADELAQAGNHLGMWTQNGNVYLDISRVGDPTTETLAKAQAAHQLAVFDLGNMERSTSAPSTRPPASTGVSVKQPIFILSTENKSPEQMKLEAQQAYQAYLDSKDQEPQQNL